MKRDKPIHTVHREVRRDGSRGPYRGWNGIGLPPDWSEWGWTGRLIFLGGLAVVMPALWFAARWLADVIVPLTH